MKNQNGPRDVNGDVEPISGKPIPFVDATEWSNMKLSSLFEQRNILYSRLYAAQDLGSVTIVSQIKKGLDLIENIIAQRSYEEN